MIYFYRSGAFISIIGWILVLILAVYYFHTPWKVILGASLVGMKVVGGKLLPGLYFKEYDINIIIVSTFAKIFGKASTLANLEASGFMWIRK